MLWAHHRVSRLFIIFAKNRMVGISAKGVSAKGILAEGGEKNMRRRNYKMSTKGNGWKTEGG